MKQMLNDQKIVKKPWGKEVIWARTNEYVGKLIYIDEGKRLSLQLHEIKEETILVLEGKLEVITANHGRKGFDILELKVGDSYHVRPHTVHRFCATLGTPVVLAEVSTNYMEDVVRLEDDYDR
jgi:mannose-6-phosphate isomerase-like protein (cupin superfamily)